MTQQSIADFLNTTRLALNNTINDSNIQTALAQYGYDNDKMAEGAALLAEAELLTEQQVARYGHQFAASQTMKQARATADATYNMAFKVARVAFKDDVQANTALILTGIRQKKFGLWIHQTLTFYNNLLADPRLLAKMATYGYPEAKLTAERALITNIRALDEIQEREKGLAQASTQSRDAKIKELKAWMKDFRNIASVALASIPQKLEALGMGPV